MGEKEILQALELPKETHILRTFPFNRLAPRFETKDRKFFQALVVPHGVRLLATINTNTTNIPAYEDEQTVYQGIHYFQIKMKDVKSAKRIYRMIAEAMPYPLLIRFVTNKEVLWIGAIHEKIKKTGLLKVQDVYSSNSEIDEKLYLTNWAFSYADTYNLKAFYENLLNQMVQIELRENYQAVTKKAFANNIVQLNTIKTLEKEITFCISKAKKENQMNKRIEWQMKANQLKEKKQKYIKGER